MDFTERITASSENTASIQPGWKSVFLASSTASIGPSESLPPGLRPNAIDGLRSAVKTGKDPQGDKATPREALTVEQLAATFLAGHVDTKLRSTTKAHYEDVLRRLVLPKLGPRRVVAYRVVRSALGTR